ncbi:putative 2-aminoethylphosphonate ABC transporter substrate-binding protein [Lachnoclostridium sp. An169]|uniref:extracellular solute-binding protein n=1 Tax=Lachnoclostridium sp. An169 TaxID=1965569 RepID=UPI000B380A42|nr:extracellular solute-binding protein [Lachnoclostridium sp. An169]OUP84323.1 putative 2-aminoethylphosphonate ABC transporter substrate-binding protein [Lachnoclostridium sp. An169]HJA66250.1 extracellular solute-binding protein [Candidatus Mediterraneibacter cottocaccae]
MKKRFVLLAMAAVMAMGALTGCVTRQGEEAKAAGNDADENVLNVYTALEDEQVTDYLEEFKELHPDVTVNVTRESTGVITSRLLAEKDNPVADVVWGLSATSLLVLKQDGMLEPYAPEGVDRILPQFKDTDETPSWVGIDAWETAWIVNKDVLADHGIDTVPTSYQDLLDPKYEGLIVMSNPASSGTGLLTVNGILSLYGEEEGWNYLDQLDKNVAVYMHSGSQPAKETAAGEYGIGISFGYRCLQSAEEVGSEICEAVFPEEGSGWDMEANALIKKDNEKQIAKDFLDWAISDNIMKKYATNYPIVAIGVGDEIPEGYSSNPLDQLIPDIDFNKAAQNRDAILAEWSDRYDAKSAPEE